MRESSGLFLALFFLLLMCSVPCSGALSDGLILYFPFDMDEAGTVTDQSGEGHHGTNHGATFTPDGQVGGAYEFDGVGDYIHVPNSTSLNSRAFTVTAWARTAEGVAEVDRGIVGKHRAGDNISYFWLYQTAGTIESMMVGQRYGVLEDVNGTIAPFVDQWGFVALTFDSTNLRLYVNGRLVDEEDIVGYVGNSYDLLVGAGEWSGGSSPQRWWQGGIDELRIYNRVLSTDEIAQLYGEEVEDAAPHVLKVGFSNDPGGDQDVTQFYRDETLYVRVRDVDLTGDGRASVRLMLQQARSGMRMIDLQRQEDGSFTGSTPLRRFGPGPVRVYLQGHGQTRLTKDSVLTILAD
jgi:hypothetical protein